MNLELPDDLKIALYYISACTREYRNYYLWNGPRQMRQFHMKRARAHWELMAAWYRTEKRIEYIRRAVEEHFGGQK